MLRHLNVIRMVCLFFMSMAITLSCKDDTTNRSSLYLISGKHADDVELSTIEDLKNDLGKVLHADIRIVSEGETVPTNATVFILGTPNSNTLITTMVKEGKLDLTKDNPGPRGGIWSKIDLENNVQAIVIGGSDTQGLQYAIYDYSKEILGVDALEYWTGKMPQPKTSKALFNFEPKTIVPPQIPILGYFENDVDELANYRGKLLEYDWESYTEMINSLVRLRYNAIQLFDMLGRPEFFIRPEYKKLSPDYTIRETYIDSLIDYAQSKGMMVQIDVSMGYKIKPLDQNKADCWKNHKQDWIDTWTYYFEETPFKKADIISLRPRNQVWDWEYKSSCGEDKIEVFNEVYQVLGDLIDQYNPKIKKVMVCYADGMEMFNQNLYPPKDWLVAWSDDGFSGFKHLPKSTKGYGFGTYMHAGFWLNHTVHDPYPKKIDTIMKNMVNDYQADKYCLVNGQQFRPFLLNIEAFSEMSKDVNAFDGEQFYKDWTQRYFTPSVAEIAVKSMKKLHEAQLDRWGYVEHLWEIRETVSYLSNAPIRRPGKTPVPYDYAAVESDYEHVEKRLKLAEEALGLALEGEKTVNKGDTFYYDYIVLPIHLYHDLLNFEHTLHQMAQLKKTFEKTNDSGALDKALEKLVIANEQLETIHRRSLEGDRNEKWKNWYNPEIRRPNNGFPSKQMLDDIKTNLALLKNSK
ncbi:glycosyl hydrolase 115 family protein [Maribacter polysiphoniae]|uniref:Glycosyl hydrolase 115 family protein n=1 Tax=Maribacter polysiphoniae TaxID=429344 RepID=A0A316DX80_9FLAO|nr:glycosyl hydrolase 115 family protein [Maribacter polysiphoniae]MBD1262108.1 glycosyl hydrolase 115 family protein [Maribacter polysiphoniae]PWK21799.1 glycosyl hydrolase family 115 (putative glucuronidase) [Maribacter polysiphoniae]